MPTVKFMFNPDAHLGFNVIQKYPFSLDAQAVDIQDLVSTLKNVTHHSSIQKFAFILDTKQQV